MYYSVKCVPDKYVGNVECMSDMLAESMSD